jgi:DNA-binding SARP family transcriptional activator
MALMTPGGGLIATDWPRGKSAVMVEFRLTLLGTFTLSGSAPLTMPSKKAQALLAYLAIPAGLPHRREKLASMLWSDRSQESGRHNLRQCLTAIRKMSDGGEEVPIIVEGDSLRLDPSNVAVDVAELEQALRSRDPNGLARAFALYRGELLEGLNLQAEPIEEWLVAERHRLRTIAIEGLVRLLEHQQRSGAHKEAMQTALRLLNIDPLQEAVHRSLMRLYHEAGNTARALWQYGICEKVLLRELNVEPEATTKELRRAILHDRSTSSRRSGEMSERRDQSRDRITRSGTKSHAPKQDIHYCMTSDGIRIAYAVTGSGPALVKVLGEPFGA